MEFFFRFLSPFTLFTSQVLLCIYGSFSQLCGTEFCQHHLGFVCGQKPILNGACQLADAPRQRCSNLFWWGSSAVPIVCPSTAPAAGNATAPALQTFDAKWAQALLREMIVKDADVLELDAALGCLTHYLRSAHHLAQYVAIEARSARFRAGTTGLGHVSLHDYLIHQVRSQAATSAAH